MMDMAEVRGYMIEAAVRSQLHEGSRHSKGSRCFVRTVGDLARYAEFINAQIVAHNHRYGIKKCLGEVLGCSPNRIGEWSRIWDAATGPVYGQALYDLVHHGRHRPLGHLVNSLRDLGWTPSGNNVASSEGNDAITRVQTEDDDFGDGDDGDDGNDGSRSDSVSVERRGGTKTTKALSSTPAADTGTLNGVRTTKHRHGASLHGVPIVDTGSKLHVVGSGWGYHHSHGPLDMSGEEDTGESGYSSGSADLLSCLSPAVSPGLMSMGDSIGTFIRSYLPTNGFDISPVSWLDSPIPAFDCRCSSGDGDSRSRRNSTESALTPVASPMEGDMLGIWVSGAL